MSRRIKVKVTASHIKDAVTLLSPAILTHCPVALALKSKGFKDVKVATHLRFCSRTGKTFYRVESPKAVMNFIYRYDSANKVKPFTFYIPLIKD